MTRPPHDDECCAYKQAAEKLVKENKILKAKVKREHENLLSAHRENMKSALRNMELKAMLKNKRKKC